MTEFFCFAASVGVVLAVGLVSFLVLKTLGHVPEGKWWLGEDEVL